MKVEFKIVTKIKKLPAFKNRDLKRNDINCLARHNPNDTVQLACTNNDRFSKKHRTFLTTPLL